MSGNIAAQVGNQGGIDFGNGTLKLSEYPTSNKNAKFDNKYQKFYHFIFRRDTLIKLQT
jgi:hypothetical protein